MTKIFVLFPTIFLSFLSYSQFAGISIGYVYDDYFGKEWRNAPGFMVGGGLEGQPLGQSSLTFSFRSVVGIGQTRHYSRIDNIEFDLPDSVGNRMGFARMDHQKFSFGLETDIGFLAWEESVIEPYATLGYSYQDYSSMLKYDLYEALSCGCYSNEKTNFSSFRTSGFTVGGGFKIRAGERFRIDFRAIYYGGWNMRTGTVHDMPDVNTLHINSYGEAAMNGSGRKYADGMNLRVALIFGLNFNGGGLRLFGNDDSDDSNSYNSNDSNDTYNERQDSQNSNDSKPAEECDPVELKPKGRQDP